MMKLSVSCDRWINPFTKTSIGMDKSHWFIFLKSRSCLHISTGSVFVVIATANFLWRNWWWIKNVWLVFSSCQITTCWSVMHSRRSVQAYSVKALVWDNHVNDLTARKGHLTINLLIDHLGESNSFPVWWVWLSTLLSFLLPFSCYSCVSDTSLHVSLSI